MKSATTHDLKCWPSFFEDVVSGRKTFEIRLADRDYKVGDALLIREWETGAYTGRSVVKRISYITNFEQKQNYIVMGLEPFPIPMLLFCPRCKDQHVDRPEPEKNWSNPPHRSHLCISCGYVWRPCDLATEGVAEIYTKGAKDQNAKPL